MASSEPTRAELLEARKQLEEQIFRTKYPANTWDRNPVLLARLEATLAGVNEALATRGETNA